MNLLLLLSALLSALTGGSAAGRAPQVAIAVAQVASEMVEPATRVRANTRPTQELPVLRAIARSTGVAWRLAPTAPLFLSRPRE